MATANEIGFDEAIAWCCKANGWMMVRLGTMEFHFIVAACAHYWLLPPTLMFIYFDLYFSLISISPKVIINFMIIVLWHAFAIFIK